MNRKKIILLQMKRMQQWAACGAVTMWTTNVEEVKKMIEEVENECLFDRCR